MSLSRTLLSLSLISAAVADFSTGQLGDAAENLNNPPGTGYYASLPSSGGPQGSILASADEGQGTVFEVKFSNLPSSGGPFLYHIHAYPVPADGNCTGTLAHLDPYIRGETPPCDPSMPATCQVGDLSGKYGTINGTSASLTYHDPYVSLQPGLGAFFGNRSFVVHYANTTRLACANFSLVGEGMIGNPNPNNPPGPPGAGSNGNVTSTGSAAPSGGTSTVSEFPSSSSYSTSTRSTTTSTTTVSSAGKVSSSSGSAKSTGSTQGIGGTGTKSAGPATVTTNGVGRMARQLNVAAPLLLVLTMLVW